MCRLRELAQPPKSLDRRMQGRLGVAARHFYEKFFFSQPSCEGLLPRDRVQIKEPQPRAVLDNEASQLNTSVGLEWLRLRS